LNLGCTCWLNAAVQALFQIPSLTRRVCAYTTDSEADACTVTTAYRDVVVKLLDKSADREDAVDPTPLLVAFRARFPSFAEDEQHDAAEAIILLLDVFETSLSKDFMDGLFLGEQTTTITTMGEDTEMHERKMVDNFTTLPVPVLEPGLDLEDLLDDACTSSLLKDYRDPDGVTHWAASVATHITRLPRVCIFVLSNSQHWPVNLPQTFEGRKLVALIAHAGKDCFGHYIAAANIKDVWWVKSDDEVFELGFPLEYPKACLAVYDYRSDTPKQELSESAAGPSTACT